jgi:hypothetical protein
MAGENPPRTRMEAIIAARYAPLVFPQPLNSLPMDGYLKQLPKFMGEGDITAEAHLESFYSFIDNHAIENEYVWMRIFVHSLDGEARKWFRALPPGSIGGIEALDEAFLKYWGDKKDLMYYITEFGSLKKEEGESVSDFSKRFNRMYNKIPTEVKPTETSAKITYASAFDPDFYLLLRERRATSLAHMQYESLEVESNIFAVDKLRSKADRDRRKGRSEASASGSSGVHPQVDELAKLVKSMSTEMEKLSLKEDRTIEVHKMLITKVTSGDLTMLLRFFQERREIEREMIRTSRPLSKIILLRMMKVRMKTLILKSTTLETPPPFLI